MIATQYASDISNTCDTTTSSWSFSVGREYTAQTYSRLYSHTYSWLYVKKEDPLIRDIRELRKALLKALAEIPDKNDNSLSTDFSVPMEAKKEVRRGYSQVPRLPGYRATRNR